MCGKWRRVGAEESIWGEWGGVWESIWGEEVCWRVGRGMGGGVGKCVRVWGPNTLSHISFTSPFPTSPLTYPTPQYTFLHLPLITLPTSRPTPQHIFLLSPHLPSPSQSVAKLPCDEISVAKLLATV